MKLFRKAAIETYAQNDNTAIRMTNTAMQNITNQKTGLKRNNTSLKSHELK